MIDRASIRGLVQLLALGLVLVVVPTLAGAKEESKIQIRLQPPGAEGGSGNGIGNGQVRADVHTRLQGATASLQINVRGAEPETEHVLLAKLDENDPDGLELARFMTGANGAFNGTFDLHKADAETPVDPRGRYLVLSDGAEDVLAGWLYGVPEDDGPRTKVKELTRLAPDEMLMPSGSVDARYDRRPNGHGTFRVSLHGVPVAEYLLFVEGVEVESVTPNPAGNAKLSFTTRPSHGSTKSKAHNRKGPLDFDPRRKLVELKQGAEVYFSGPMLAQIDGVNVCSASESSTPFALGPGQLQGSGQVVLAVENDCETSVEVEVADLPVASYDLYVDDALVGVIAVSDDGMGNLSGRIDFDPNPDEPDEVPLDFPVGSGAVFDVYSAGADPAMVTPLLSATLP